MFLWMQPTKQFNFGESYCLSLQSQLVMLRESGFLDFVWIFLLFFVCGDFGLGCFCFVLVLFGFFSFILFWVFLFGLRFFFLRIATHNKARLVWVFIIVQQNHHTLCLHMFIYCLIT